MTLRGTVTQAEETRMLDGTGRWVFKVEVKRLADTLWTDVTDVAGGDWVLSISTDADSPDRPVNAFTVRLLRAADGVSMSPGMAGSTLNNAAGIYSPIIFPGRLIRVFAANLAPGEVRADAVWHPWLVGEIDNAGFADDVVAQCVSQDAMIQNAQIEAEEIRGQTDPGTPLEDEVQGLLDRWITDDPVTLLVVGDPDHGVGEYKTEPGSLGDFLLAQAQRIAWDLRYRWDDASEDFRYTLYLPPRGKVTPDLTLPANQIFDVPELSVERSNVRNAFTWVYPDKDTGKPETRYALNQESIDEFRRRWMGVQEPQESSINTAAKADALLSYASSDLGRPPTEKRLRLPFLPFLALHHMLRIEADGKRFDFDQNYSVVGVAHDVTPEGAHTLANLRGGSPVGMYYAWRRRNAGSGAQPISPETEGLINFREYTDANGITVLAWDGIGSLVQEVWAGSVVFNLPLPTDPWALVAGAVLPLTPGTLSLTYPQPGEGQRRLIQVETRLAFMEQGPTYRVNQFGTPAPIDWRAVPTETAGDVTLAVSVTDSRGVLDKVQFYTLVLGVRSGPFDATVSADNYYAYTVALDPKHPVGIQPELVRNDGFPPILGETYTADIDKEATVIDVRKTRAEDTGVDTVFVDGDTDTVSLWYKEDVSGVLGSETSIAARGADPRFGSFTVNAGATERIFRVYGKNAAGTVGPYVDLRINVWTAPPPVLPSISALWLVVVNRPNSGGPGYWDLHDVSWDISSAVNDTDHGISVTFYTGGVEVTTVTAAPSDGTVTYDKAVGGNTVRQHTCKVMVYELVGGGTVAMMESVPVSTTIDTTPYP